MTNLFTDLQGAIADILRAEEVFQVPPSPGIVTEVVGDVSTAIEKELGKNGLSIAIATPEVTRGSESVPGELLVEVLVDVSERPSLNRGASGCQKRAVDVAYSIVAALWLRRASPSFSPLRFSRTNLVAATPDRVTYEVRFHTTVRVTSTDETGESQ